MAKSSPQTNPSSKTASGIPALTGKAGVDPRQASRDIDSPTLTRKRGGVWLFLLPCLLLALVLTLPELNRPDVTDRTEARTVASSMQSRQRQLVRGAADEPFKFEQLVPYYNGRPQLSDPPATVWLQVGAFSLADSMGFDRGVKARIGQARLLSVIMALLAVASMYWLGYAIGEGRTAIFSALIFTANPLFIYHARLATPAMHMLAWTTLSIAAAVWAIRPLRPAPSVERQLIGWFICGLSMGAATLTIGIHGVFLSALPVLIILILCPNRISHLLGLLAAVLIHSLMILAWAVHSTETWQLVAALAPSNWTGPVIPMRDLAVYAGWLLLALLPWTIWLGGALIQPFSASSEGERTRMFLGWSWFAVFILLLAFWPRQGTASMLPLLAPVAVLIGHLFNRYSNLAAEARFPRSWRIARWPHLALLLLISIDLPAMMLYQSYMVRESWIDRVVALDMDWWYDVGYAVALLAIVSLIARWALKDYPARVLVATALWTAVVLGLAIIPLSRGPLAQNQHRPVAARIAESVGQHRVFWLPGETPSQTLDPAVVLYVGKSVPMTTREQIEQIRQIEDTFFVLTVKGDDDYVIQRFTHEPQVTTPAEPDE